MRNAKYLLLPIILVCCLTAGEAKETVSVEASLSSERIYEGEPVALSVSITTTNPDIAYIELMSREDFQGFTILNVPTADASDGHLTRIQKNGEKAYTAVIYRIMLMPNAPGTLTIPSLEFNIGLSRPTVIDHPYFGHIRSTTVEDAVLRTKPVKAKCNRLPRPADGYSGAIGNFTIEGSVPPGKIYADSPALVIFRISGTGYIDSSSFPDIRKHLPKGMVLRTEEESSDFICVGEELQSTIELECTLVAGEPGEYVVPPIPFTFFDPVAESYRTVSSKQLTINAEGIDIPSKPKVLHSI